VSSIEFEIPDGFGIPLVDLDTDLLPQPTMDALDALYAGGGGGGAVDSVNGQTGVVVLDADDIADGTTNHAFTAADDTKLAGIAPAATANSADATLLARENHTGTQLAATISDFSTAADARVVAGITGKANTSHTHAASDIASGTVATARLGSGSASGSTFLRGDQTWATPAGGTNLSPIPRVTGRYYIGELDGAGTDDGGTLTNGTAYMAPFRVGGGGQSFDRIACVISTAGAASSVVRLGIYASDANGLPGSLHLDAGTTAADVTGDKTITISTTLSDGLYWLLMVTNDASGTLRVRKTAGGVQAFHQWVYGSGGQGVDDMGQMLRSTGWTAGSSLPGTASMTGLTSRQHDYPLVWIRKA
jgi:hypothetical protein